MEEEFNTQSILQRLSGDFAVGFNRPGRDTQDRYNVSIDFVDLGEQEPEPPQEEQERVSQDSSGIDSMVSLDASDIDNMLNAIEQEESDFVPSVEELMEETTVEEENVPQEQEPEQQEPEQIEVSPFESVNVREETLRFSSAVWFEEVQKRPILLAGVGGIGSWVSFLLAKLQPQSIILYDPDTVELVNMAGQLYKSPDVGKPKVDALADTIRIFTNYGNVCCYPHRYTQQSAVNEIMICGFDNMQARSTFYLNWKNLVHTKTQEEKKECLFIDGRLAAEELQILCFTGDDYYAMSQYESRFRFVDGDAEYELCSFKQTAFMANMIGALIVNLVVNFYTNLTNPGIPRTLPFFTQYQADMMFFNVEK